MWAGFRLIVCWAVLSACFDAQAEDLGQVGRAWPVAERDLTEVIIGRLREKEASGELKRLHEGMRARARDYVRAPHALGLPRVKASRSYLFDPSITVPYDLADDKGRVFYKAGQRVNPLEHRSLTRRIVFLDAADTQQLAWLRRELSQPGAVKLVLTGGSPEAVRKAVQQPVWFDQDGSLVKTFGITAVPAIVAQEGQQLRIREVRP